MSFTGLQQKVSIEFVILSGVNLKYFQNSSALISAAVGFGVATTAVVAAVATMDVNKFSILNYVFLWRGWGVPKKRN